MTEDSPPALVLHDDDIWVWRGGRVLGPRNFPLILGVLSIPLVVVCGSVALSGKPRAALDYFVVTLCIVAMIMMLFARFTAFSRVIEIRAAPDRIRLKFAWGVRRTYPTSDLKNLTVVHQTYEGASRCHATQLRLTFRNDASRYTERWTTGQTRYAPDLRNQWQHVLDGPSIDETFQTVRLQRSSDWR